MASAFQASGSPAHRHGVRNVLASVAAPKLCAFIVGTSRKLLTGMPSPRTQRIRARLQSCRLSAFIQGFSLSPDPAPVAQHDRLIVGRACDRPRKYGQRKSCPDTKPILLKPRRNRQTSVAGRKWRVYGLCISGKWLTCTSTRRAQRISVSRGAEALRIHRRHFTQTAHRHAEPAYATYQGTTSVVPFERLYSGLQPLSPDPAPVTRNESLIVGRAPLPPKHV